MFRVAVGVLVLAAGVAFLPMWAPLVLAVWVATMTRPLLARIAKVTGGRQGAAAGIVVLLVVLLFVPLGLASVSLVSGAVELSRGVMQSDGAKNALVAIASGGQPGGGDAGGLPSLGALASPEKIVALVQEHGAQAARLLGGIAGMASAAVLGLFIFLYAVYVFLIDGPAQYAWLEEHAPLPPEPMRRLVAAFHETGRGLFVGVGLTGLSQGLVATIAYLALGVPRALVLGLITCIASLLPSIGTALVWVPVAAGLALSGHPGKAGILSGIGILVIGTVDNVLRPVFARLGELDLSTFVLLTSIFGGLAVFGAWGVLLGPLFARLAKEGLVLAREHRLRGDG